MAMSLNLTLVVQIAHFFVAYLLVTHFFLRPAYRTVKADDNRFRQIKSRVVARQELIAHKELYKQKRWVLFQDYFNRQKPQLLAEVVSDRSARQFEAAKPLSAGGVRTLSKEIARDSEERLFS